MNQKRARWRKLDNAAKLFLAASTKRDTRVFRFYCELKEEVKKGDPAESAGSDGGDISGVSVCDTERVVLELSGNEQPASGSAGGV